MQLRFILSLLSVCVFLSIFAYVRLKDSTIDQAPTENEDKLMIAKSVFWSYEGEHGPEQWMNVDSGYEACGRGEVQSPINIEVSKTDKVPSKLKIDYQIATFTLENNGHTIEANTTSKNNSLMIEGKEYDFVGMHFHAPSEHQINGQNFEMELHMFHESEDGNLAVVGVFAKSGKENNTLAQMLSILPENPEDLIEVKKPVDLLQLLPKEKSVFHYVGSLTTPPCTEGVQWFVLEQPIEMSEQQIDSFWSIFPGNNRPIQEVNNREIEYIAPKE